MKTYIMVICFMILSTAVAAQDLFEFEEVTAGNFFGVGARQMSMGGAGIASVLDGSALYYNPAALARIHKIELQLGLTHQKFSNETSQPPNRYDGFTSTLNTTDFDQTKTRFGTLNLTVPVPTYRGSLTLAFGINRVQSFDRTSLFHVIDRDDIGNVIEDYAKEFETGSIYAYSGGFGLDISPNVSLGAALHVYSGDDEFNYDYYTIDNAADYEEYGQSQNTQDYIGVSAKGGLLARPNEHLSFGIVIETPIDYQVEWFLQDEYYGQSGGVPFAESTTDYVEYDLTRPFIFGAGAAIHFGTFMFTADAEYADWSQMSYNDNIDMETKSDSLSVFYRDVFNLRGGIEYQFPQHGLALRAGAFSNPLPYREDDVYDGRRIEFIDSDRRGFSLGLGWLIDDVLLLEGAYVRGTATRLYSPRNWPYVNIGADLATAEDTFSRVYVTMSYRY